MPTLKSASNRKSEQSSAPGAVRRYTSQDLFGRADTVWIDHGGQCYALRRTRQGKLILTK